MTLTFLSVFFFSFLLFSSTLSSFFVQINLMDTRLNCESIADDAILIEDCCRGKTFGTKGKMNRPKEEKENRHGFFSLFLTDLLFTLVRHFSSASSRDRVHLLCHNNKLENEVWIEFE